MPDTANRSRKPLKALLVEGIHPGAREALAAEGILVTMMPGSPPPDELKALVADVDLIGIRSKTRLTADILDAAPNLMSNGCFRIGTNQVDLAHANVRGVPVFNAPFSNTRSVAELMIAEIVMLARQIGDRSREVHDGNWQKKATRCREIRGKTLGIVGYGHIGSQLGVLAESMGMRVIFFDVVKKLPMGNNRAASSLGELLREADFVTLHVPETAQTRNLIGYDELAAMKDGSYLLNASRGSVVVIPALADVIRSGHLAGAAIDVYPEEPEKNGQGFESELRGLLRKSRSGGTEVRKLEAKLEKQFAAAKWTVGQIRAIRMRNSECGLRNGDRARRTVCRLDE